MTQQLTKLDMNSLSQLDGGACGIMVTRQMAAILRDCMDRPNLNKTRKLTLTIEFTPISDGHDLTKIEIVPKVKSAIPVYQASPMVAFPRGDMMAVQLEGLDGDIDE